MPAQDTIWAIRQDVAVAMALTVIEKTAFSQSNYSESIIPKKEPIDGFGASLPFWGYILGIVESRLESKNNLYIGFNVTNDFILRTVDISINETNNRITQSIISQFSFGGAV